MKRGRMVSHVHPVTQVPHGLDAQNKYVYYFNSSLYAYTLSTCNKTLLVTSGFRFLFCLRFLGKQTEHGRRAAFFRFICSLFDSVSECPFSRIFWFCFFFCSGNVDSWSRTLSIKKEQSMMCITFLGLHFGLRFWGNWFRYYVAGSNYLDKALQVGQRLTRTNRGLALRLSHHRFGLCFFLLTIVH